jgi:hypothetical protein
MNVGIDIEKANIILFSCCILGLFYSLVNFYMVRKVRLLDDVEDYKALIHD